MDHPRRQKLIKPGLQLRIIATFFFVTACAVLTQVLTLRFALQRAAEKLPNDGDLLRNMMPGTVLDGVVLAAVILVPLVTFVGVLATVKIAGPAHAFEAYLRSFLEGTRPAPCRLRKRDEFKDLCELINQATQSNLPALPTILRTSGTAVVPAGALPSESEASEVPSE